MESTTNNVNGKISKEKKQAKYDNLYGKIRNMIADEKDLVANMANVTSFLQHEMGFFWTGFYIARGHELVLGPFQGTVGCTRIRFGKGVCGKSWSTGNSIIVPNVDEFEGHIACSPLTKSEIVIPIYKGAKVVGVLDIDSDLLDYFDEVDQENLEKVVRVIGKKF
jgi:GAF domain-containing protein